jgi:hypothetical protein
MEVAEFKISTEYDGRVRRLYSRECGICESTFWVPKYRTNKYCSKACSGRAQTALHTITLECDNCGISCIKKLGNLRNSKSGKYFCTRKCKDYAQSLDGTCPAIRPSHYGNGKSSYRSRTSVQRRLSGCVGCGEMRLFMLDVHHMDKNRRNNMRSNLEIVCANCHRKRHLKYLEGEWIYDNRVITPRDVITSLGS